MAIPADRTAFLSLWTIGLVLGIAAMVIPGSGWLSGIVGAIAALGNAMMLGFYLLGGQRARDAIGVDDPIPVFSGTDEHHRTVHSGSLTGTWLLIKFFRGHW